MTHERPDTEEEGVALIHAAYGPGLDLNRMKGVPGNFYRENRRGDLLELVEEILDSEK